MKIFVFILVSIFSVALVGCGRNGQPMEDAIPTVEEPPAPSGAQPPTPPPVDTPEGQPSPSPAEVFPTEVDIAQSLELWDYAEVFWDIFTAGDIPGAMDLMTEAMQELGEDAWAGLLQEIVATGGDFVEGSTELMLYQFTDEHHVFDFVAHNITTITNYRIAIDHDGLIAGFFVMHREFLQYDAADLHFDSEPISLGQEWPLDGILTIPHGASEDEPVPAILLVHGSGNMAGDMDSSLFGNRPFFDIASYLSANGIAVLRYNKRTFSHGAELIAAYPDNFTVWQETVEDAIFAAELLRDDPRIDPNRIFMLGHSLGGMVAPRIHLQGGDFAGMVLFATTPLSFTDIIIEQNQAFLETADAQTREVLLPYIREMTALLNNVQYMTPQEARDMPFDGGATFYYLRDLAIYSFQALIPQVQIPLLIIHGTHDFQTTAESSIPAFEETLAGRDDVTIQVHYGLNHMMMPSVATEIHDIMDDYAIPNNVDEQVLRNIAAWVNEN
ncbi:MAG: lysophospholipase [Defluviitaleaceae bacterium]|nr:lysophospholipase [Defluviitaleaceae bacterium]